LGINNNKTMLSDRQFFNSEILLLQKRYENDIKQLEDRFKYLFVKIIIVHFVVFLCILIKFQYIYYLINH